MFCEEKLLVIKNNNKFFIISLIGRSILNIFYKFISLWNENNYENCRAKVLVYFDVEIFKYIHPLQDYFLRTPMFGSPLKFLDKQV